MCAYTIFPGFKLNLKLVLVWWHRLFFAITASLFISSNVQATVILNIDVGIGILLGAQNVVVVDTDGGTHLYDVVFIDGIFSSIFTDASQLDVKLTEPNRITGTMFSQALLDQVFIDVGIIRGGTDGAFDTNPGLTNGCAMLVRKCLVITPDIFGTTGWEGTFAGNSANEDFDEIANVVELLSFDSRLRNGIVFADWTLSSSVPEPSTLALMSLGLLGLGFSRRKRLQ